MGLDQCGAVTDILSGQEMLRQGVWLCREHLEAVLRGSEMREFSRVCLRLDNIARHGRKPSS